MLKINIATPINLDNAEKLKTQLAELMRLEKDLASALVDKTTLGWLAYSLAQLIASDTELVAMEQLLEDSPRQHQQLAGKIEATGYTTAIPFRTDMCDAYPAARLVESLLTGLVTVAQEAGHE